MDLIGHPKSCGNLLVAPEHSQPYRAFGPADAPRSNVDGIHAAQQGQGLDFGNDVPSHRPQARNRSVGVSLVNATCGREQVASDELLQANGDDQMRTSAVDDPKHSAEGAATWVADEIRGQAGPIIESIGALDHNVAGLQLGQSVGER
jgi:hypothetical protein